MARPALEAAAGVHEVVCARVLREIRDHRSHDGEVVHARADAREQVADGDAAFAVAAELPRTLEHVADVVELSRVGLDLDRLAVLAIEPGLGVEGIELGGTAVHEEKDDALRLGREMRGSGRERVFPGVGLVRLGLGRLVRQDRAEGRIAKEHRRRQRAKTGAASQEHVAAAQARCEKSLTVHSGPQENPAQRAVRTLQVNSRR